jgi:hypothetical protein
VAVLGAAWILQGLATGAAIGALSAVLAELDTRRSPGVAAVVSSAAPTFGLAAGGLGASALVQYGPDRLRLVYWILLGGLMLGTVVIATMRETGEPRAGVLASLKPNAAVPPEARSTFLAVIPCLVALWALSGFYLSLAPGLASGIVGSRNLLWGGAVIFALCASGGIAVIAAKGSSARSAMLYGCVALFAGVAVTFAAIASGAIALFLIGSVIGGVGFGLAFLGAFRAVSMVAAPAQRAGTIAAMYVVSYLAFSIPIVIAGIATTHFGAHDVALVFSAAVAGLAAVGALAGLLAHRQAPDRPLTAGSTIALPPCPGTVPPHIELEAPALVAGTDDRATHSR